MLGETRVYPLTDFPERFLETESVLVGEGRVMMQIESARQQPNVVVIKFAGVGSREAAEKLKGSYLYVHVSEAVALPEGSFYTWKLTGLRALTEDGQMLGTVREVITGAGNDLLVVVGQGKNPAYIPFVREFVRDINLETGEIRIRPIPGLIE